MLSGAAQRPTHVGYKPQKCTSEHVRIRLHSGSGTPRTQQNQLMSKHWAGGAKRQPRDEFLLPSYSPILETIGDQLFQNQR